ncbi:MAG: hypothetical protein PHV53_10985 [Fermentimonas sp.]|nr:hypothetical protein [Fermentimonas sp.]
MIFWSKKYADKARAEREETIKKALDIIANPKKHNKSTVHGAAAYIKNITFDKKTGEIYEEPGKKLLYDEDNFKVSKSDLDIRPVHVSREDRINAHVLICFISLVIIVFTFQCFFAVSSSTWVPMIFVVKKTSSSTPSYNETLFWIL